MSEAIPEGGEQADHSGRPHESHRPLHEQGVEIHVATGQPGIVAAGPRDAKTGFRSFVRSFEVGGQRVAPLSKLSNHALPVRSALRASDLGAAGGEPLHLLQLHPIPGRIADHRIEAALPFRRGPTRTRPAMRS